MQKVQINNINIRNAVISDAEALQSMFHKYHGTHESFSLDNIKESIETGNVYIATNEDNHIIGALTSEQVFDNYESDIPDGGIIIGNIQSIGIGDERIWFDNYIKKEMRDLCVADAYRNRGIASALLEHALKESKDASYALVWAPGGKARAKKLWEEHDFELQKVVKDIGTLAPWFCENCVERKNNCNYCECHVYVEKKPSKGVELFPAPLLVS